jgi:hypothetical protein
VALLAVNEDDGLIMDIAVAESGKMKLQIVEQSGSRLGRMIIHEVLLELKPSVKVRYKL